MQSIAYSNDRSRTFVKYAGNPVLGHRALNKPQVIWHAHQPWVMLFWMAVIMLFSSQTWQWDHLCDLRSEAAVPTFELPVDGDPQHALGLLGAAGVYRIGTFDASLYAGNAALRAVWRQRLSAHWSNVPAEDGHRSNPGWRAVNAVHAFQSAVVFPQSALPDGISVCRPVREIERLHAWE